MKFIVETCCLEIVVVATPSNYWNNLECLGSKLHKIKWKSMAQREQCDQSAAKP
jgi:hypothetical protein